ncbi:hypothetical protein N665_0089s0087 [Sinapis alba]|nr:hypothetical protein N665_0089s0087 [Sinapis alba]
MRRRAGKEKTEGSRGLMSELQSHHESSAQKVGFRASVQQETTKDFLLKYEAQRRQKLLLAGGGGCKTILCSANGRERRHKTLYHLEPSTRSYPKLPMEAARI